ncbi:MAG TPA: STAS domain-containing protein [Acidimicrobiales bacterium]|nr:STAS domain-containing protein [Acidimicrobiales bacterium]
MTDTAAPQFDLVRVDVSGHPVLLVYGELDVMTTPRLHEALEQVVAEEPSNVLIDLANVTFLDSTALGALVVAHRHMQDRGGELRLVAVPPAVAKVFDMTGLTERFHIYADADSAAGPKG